MTMNDRELEDALEKLFGPTSATPTPAPTPVPAPMPVVAPALPSTTPVPVQPPLPLRLPEQSPTAPVGVDEGGLLQFLADRPILWNTMTAGDAVSGLGQGLGAALDAIAWVDERTLRYPRQGWIEAFRPSSWTRPGEQFNLLNPIRQAVDPNFGPSQRDLFLAQQERQLAQQLGRDPSIMERYGLREHHTPLAGQLAGDLPFLLVPGGQSRSAATALGNLATGLGARGAAQGGLRGAGLQAAGYGARAGEYGLLPFARAEEALDAGVRAGIGGIGAATQGARRGLADILDPGRVSAQSPPEQLFVPEPQQVLPEPQQLFIPQQESQPIIPSSLRAVAGRDTQAFVPERPAYDFQVQVVDLDDPDLLVSHNAYTFDENPEYPSWLQPRERGSEAMRLNLQNLRQNFDPDALMRDHLNLTEGIPIVAVEDGKLVTESGNGRMMLLRGSDDTYRQYRTRLNQYATQYGIPPESLASFSKPVLVRVRRTPLDENARREMVNIANGRAAAAFSEVEEANIDAQRITPQMLSELNFSEQSDISLDNLLDQAHNRGFLRDFIGSLPETEQVTMTERGALSQAGQRRVRNALFARVFGDEGSGMVRRFFQSTEEMMKSAQNGITRVLPRLLQVTARVTDGSLRPDADISQPLAEAMQTVSTIQQRGGRGKLETRVNDYLAQFDFSSDSATIERDLLMMAMSKNAPVKLARALNQYLDAVLAYPDLRAPTFGSMEVPPIDRIGLLTQAVTEGAELDASDAARVAEWRDYARASMQAEQPAVGPMQQAVLGDDFATNQNLEMPMGAGRAETPPMADPELLAARQERQDLEAAGQQGFGMEVDTELEDALDRLTGRAADDFEATGQAIEAEESIDAMTRSPEAEVDEALGNMEVRQLATEIKQEAQADKAIVDMTERAGSRSESAFSRTPEEAKTTIRIGEERADYEQAEEIADRISKNPNPKPISMKARAPYEIPPRNYYAFEDILDIVNEPFGSMTVDNMLARHNGKVNELRDRVNLDWLNMKPVYQQLGIQPGQFSEVDDDLMNLVLHGEADLSTLADRPELADFVNRVRQVDAENEIETRAFLTWARKNGVFERLPYLADLEMRMDAINARTGGHYHPRPWQGEDFDDLGDEVVEAAARVNLGSEGARPGYTFARSLKSYQELRAEGKKPLYDDPMLVSIASRIQRERFQTAVALFHRLHREGMVKPASEVTEDMRNSWRVPDVGRPYLGARIQPQFERTPSGSRKRVPTNAVVFESTSYAVPNYIADYLERMRGIRPAWNVDFDAVAGKTGIPQALGRVGVNTPGLGEHDLYRWMTGSSDYLKIAKFALSPFQMTDMMLRAVNFHMGPSQNYHGRGMPMLKIGKVLADTASTYFRSTESRTRRNLERALSADEFTVEGKNFSHLMYTRNGLARGGDRSVFFDAVIKPGLTDLVARSVPEGSAIKRGYLNSTRWLQQGLFETFYDNLSLHMMDNVEVPRQARLHPDWTPDQIAQEAARVINTMMSSPEQWQRFFVTNPRALHWARLPFISINETRSWFGIALEALPIPKNTSWRSFMDFWGGLFILYGAFTEMLTYAATGEHATWKDFWPLTADYESPYAVDYSSDFMRPPVPGLRGRGDRQIHVDLMGQADTPFRFLNPVNFVASRLSIPVRMITNQITGKQFFGEELGQILPYPNPRRLYDAIAGPLPMPIEAGVQAFRSDDNALGNWVPEAEGRLGTSGNIAQGFGGFNLTAESNRAIRDRTSQRLGLGPSYTENEPYQKRIVNRELSDELELSAQTGARRNQPWSQYQARLHELDAEQQRRYEGLAQQTGGGWTIFGGAAQRQRSRDIVRAYFDIESEMAQRRDEAARNFGIEFGERPQHWTERVGDLFTGGDQPTQNEQVLDAYHQLTQQSVDQSGNFNYDIYTQARDRFLALLSPDQRLYILRNTNMTPVPEALLMILRQSAPSEFERIMQSEMARQQHLQNR